MSRSPPSNIQVFPSFPETAFFSGEEFTCVLTFKNVAEVPSSSSSRGLTLNDAAKGRNRVENIEEGETEWNGESEKGVVDGGTLASAKSARSTPRERSTGGSSSDEQTTSRINGMQRGHGRSQSAVVTPTLAETPVFKLPSPAKQEPPDVASGLQELKIDTSTPTSNTLPPSPSEVPQSSHSPLSSNQINKLDLHSVAEDDASSEASSVEPPKPQPSIFNIFSPRSSLDIRDSERDSMPALRRPTASRRLPRSPLGRSSMDVGPRLADNLLMMGFAQIIGHFTVDEALIRASEFDEVKTRGVMGGKSAGGVVSVDSKRTNSWTGLGGSLGGSIQGSLQGVFGLGSIFGAEKQSSLAEMQDRASQKNIPVVSTPPSILFVDMRLAPGESKSFSYSVKLPKTLPPSHRGQALRISYSLVITTQRPGRLGQQMSTVAIPFRLFSHIDEYGRQPKYDLKVPIIILRDEAKTSAIKETESQPVTPTIRPPIRRSSTYSDKPIESSQDEFMDFVDRLLASLGKAPISASEPFLSLATPRTPSPTPTKERFRPLSCRESVDFAIQKELRTGALGKRKAGIFEIGKNGLTLATLTLSRMTFKLGETIEGIIDIENGPIKCFQIRAALESAEDIDQVISQRSQSSTYRATRLLHGTKSEFTTFARRIQFAFEIPVGVAPSFQTSYVRHHWSIRLEFVTSLFPSQNTDEISESPDAPPVTSGALLELVERDERNSVYAATETLLCESFDCHVPVVVLPTNQDIPEDRIGLAGFVV